MAVVQIPNLPVIINVMGGEQFEAVQAGVSGRITLNQIAFWVQNFPATVYPTGNFCTNRQWRLALAADLGFSPNALIEVDNNVPADISDPINIQWNHGNWIVVGDTVYLFTKTVLGYNNAQMLTLLGNALAYPL